MRKKTGYFFLILAILSTVFIFSNSMQTATQSDNISNAFVAFIIEVLNLKTENLTIIVRKSAHMIEFFIQSVLMGLCAKYLFYHYKKYISTTLLLSLITAVTDETIQLFYEGRSGQVTDIIIDFSGAVLGVVFCIFILFITKRKKGSDT